MSAAIAVPPSAARLAENRRLCDRVNLAIMGSKSGGGKQSAGSALQRNAETGSRETLGTNFQMFSSFLQGECNVYGCDTLASAEGSPVGSAVLLLSANRANTGSGPASVACPVCPDCIEKLGVEAERDR
jgi:hypothetical protein